MKPTTVGIRFRALRAFFNWAVAEDEIDMSPMRGLKEPRGKDEPPAVLSDEDLRRWLDACKGKGFTERAHVTARRLGFPVPVQISSMTCGNSSTA